LTFKGNKVKWVASFPSFAWPKTTLQRGTEHGLTSEFGMGSGGTRALWPANPSLLMSIPLLTLRFCWGSFYEFYVILIGGFGFACSGVDMGCAYFFGCMDMLLGDLLFNR
jgi:hypothetical protein